MKERGVRDHLPSQQGLRLFGIIWRAINFRSVRDHLPSQQGLRLLSRVLCLCARLTYETIFHHNKD